MGTPWSISSSEILFALYVINQPGQVHFCSSRLKAASHRSLRQLLELICARALQKEIGIATEVVDARKADRVDPFLDNGMCSSRKSGRSEERRGGKEGRSPGVPHP